MKAIIASVLILSSASFARAEESVEQRQQNQEKRIADGVKDGSLTQKEATHLEKEEQHIEKRKEKMEADGTLSPKEKRRLERMEDHASRDIYRKRHNARKAK